MSPRRGIRSSRLRRRRRGRRRTALGLTVAVTLGVTGCASEHAAPSRPSATPPLRRALEYVTAHSGNGSRSAEIRYFDRHYGPGHPSPAVARCYHRALVRQVPGTARELAMFLARLRVGDRRAASTLTAIRARCFVQPAFPHG